MITSNEGPLLAVFAAVARAGSFSAAAATLGLSKSLVSERVRMLEERCGARLLERTTRRVRLTAAGAEVLDATTKVEDSLGLLSRNLDERRAEPTGELRVSTTNDLGALLVAPTVARFVAAYPKVSVDILAEDSARDLIETGIDVAVRLGAPKSSSFVARKLAVLEEPIVATPSLAGQLGAAARPSALADAPWVRHSLLASATLRFTGPGGRRDELKPTFRAQANTGSTLLSLLLHGAGVGVLPEHAIREHVHERRLVVLCPGWSWKQVALYTLVPSRAAQHPARRAFIAMLQDQLARDRARWSPERAAP